jgi:hypothetical protein
VVFPYTHIMYFYTSYSFLLPPESPLVRNSSLGRYILYTVKQSETHSREFSHLVLIENSLLYGSSPISIHILQAVYTLDMERG